MVFELIGLGIACLLAPAIAEHGKLRHKAEKGFNWLALAGVWFVFAAAFLLVPFSMFGLESMFAAIGSYVTLIGWFFALVGTLFVGYEILVEK